MKIEGKVTKESKFWISSIPILAFSTQGRTKKEALEMAKSGIAILLDDDKYTPILSQSSSDSFGIKFNDSRPIISLILRRQREERGLSIADVVKKLGFSSRNAYARYENSSIKISLSKFIELYNAITSEDIILKVNS